MHLHPEAQFLVQAFILIGLPYFVWRVKAVNHFFPLVVLQIFAGILLGPTVLGKLSPQAFHFLFPSSSLPFLNGLSWLAIVFFGFLTGLHFDVKELKGKGAAFVSISLSSILIPMILGFAAGWWLFHAYPNLVGPKATQFTFAFGLGLSAGVTALPVLSAILLELGMITTSTGKTILGFATMIDGMLWIFVTILLSLVSSEGPANPFGVIRTIGMLAVYLGIMLFVVKPLVASFVTKKIWTVDPNNVQLFAVTCMLILSSLATELIGIHYLLGAFIFGALIPKEIAMSLYHKKEPLVLVALIPFFFMVTGLRTNADISDISVIVIFAIMTVITVVGKLFGTTAVARYFKYPLNTAFLFGSFMLCKGLMDIVVLNVMLSAQVISNIAFSGMVIIAVTNTAITKPLILLLQRFKSSEVDTTTRRK
jgi:Kef-type K+ transport system membrane component KefB